jgi:sugar lactone lactonase YvrE
VQEFVAKPCSTDQYFLGECCRWDDGRGELYWVDILSGRFFRAKADATAVTITRTYQLAGSVAALAPMENRSDGWIVALDQSLVFLNEAGELREVAEPEGHHAPRVRLNDGAADPWGRFVVGSMASDESEGQGSLYRFHESSGTELLLGDVTVSNGLGWSPDQRTMYYVDSGPGTISTFDVDGNGALSNRQLFAQFDSEREGSPDGLCVDRNGDLWVAFWGGYEVRQFSSAGEQLARVSLNTAQPSSCAIGGANGTTLYITTAQEDMSSETLAHEPDAGRLFCVDVQVEGLPINAYRPTLHAANEKSGSLRVEG